MKRKEIRERRKGKDNEGGEEARVIEGRVPFEG